jgi:long-subunit acyl-CoA synthetase (AMP-forming)
VSILLRGIQVVFCPEAEKLVEYLSFVKPTHVVVVPCILSKVYDTVMTEASRSQLKLFLVQQALSRKESW